MIPYRLTEEKETILHYAKLLDDQLALEIVHQEKLQSSDEALHLAAFYWKMVDASNEEDKKTGNNSEYILEKIIITFMAWFRSNGYEEEWEKIVDD